MSNRRLKASISAEFKVGDHRAKGLIKNISENGLFMGTLAVPEVGETVEVSFRAPGAGRVRVSGLVWWTTEDLDTTAYRRPQGFGLRILEGKLIDTA